MINASAVTDTLAISSALEKVFPKTKNKILWHADARLKAIDVSHYYECQLGLALNNVAVALFLYQNNMGQYVLTDLGTLIFTNQIIEPLAIKQESADGDQQKYENYDVFACQVVKAPWFQKFLARFHLQLQHATDITATLDRLDDLPAVLKHFAALFQDLSAPKPSVQA